MIAMDILATLIAFKYPAIFFLAIFEGPVTMAAVGFLFTLGYFEIVPAYVALLLGDLAGDLGWYALGYFGAHRFIRRFGTYFSITEASSQKISLIFRNHEGKILFLSKITMGFGFAVATLFAAGMSRVPLKKFIGLNLLGGFVWTAIMLSLGYLFGNISGRVSGGLRIGTIIFFIVFLLVALRGFSTYMKQRMLRTNKI